MATVPQPPKSAQSASSCVSNGRLPRKTEHLVFSSGAAEPRAAAESMRRWRPKAGSPLAAVAALADAAAAKTTKAFTESRTAASTVPVMSAAPGGSFGFAGAADRTNTRSTSPYCAKCREICLRVVATGTLPTKTVRASRSGSSPSSPSASSAGLLAGAAVAERFFGFATSAAAALVDAGRFRCSPLAWADAAAAAAKAAFCAAVLGPPAAAVLFFTALVSVGAFGGLDGPNAGGSRRRRRPSAEERRHLGVDFGGREPERRGWHVSPSRARGCEGSRLRR